MALNTAYEKTTRWFWRKKAKEKTKSGVIRFKPCLDRAKICFKV